MATDVTRPAPLSAKGTDLIPAADSPSAIAAKKRAQSRERSRRYRKRMKAGLRRIAVDLPGAELDDALIDRGYLAPERADDNEAVRTATEQFTRAAILHEASPSRVTR